LRETGQRLFREYQAEEREEERASRQGCRRAVVRGIRAERAIDQQQSDRQPHDR
jgi:hypothetical protein